MPPESRYKFPNVEKQINRIIGFIFYYRLAYVLIVILIAIGFGIWTWRESTELERLKNIAAVFTGASIIIGISYSIINHEHNHLRFKHENKKSRDILTFSTACKVYDKEMMMYLRVTKDFYELRKNLFTSKRFDEIMNLLNENQEVKQAFLISLNYMECTSIGIQQDIMDELFMKNFLKGIFCDQLRMYGEFIRYWREERNSPENFKFFTNLATKWRAE